ncbi:hypothetical protein BJX64DRAFT_265744 [Aspergillus heterothallicus]
MTAWHVVRLIQAKPAFFTHTKLGPGVGVGTHVNINNALHAWKRTKEDLVVLIRCYVPVGAAPTQAGLSSLNPVNNRLYLFKEVFRLPLAEASRLQEAFKNRNQDRIDRIDRDQELTRLKALVEEVSGVKIK